ncbi:MAG: DUF6418 domain-containing protein [Caldimonas sp.]
MLTVLFAGIVVLAYAWLIRSRTAAALAGFFVLFSLATRTLSLSYIDLAGPVYAVELETFIGGGSSMPLFACGVLAFLLPLGYAFRPSRLSAALRPTASGPMQARRGTAHFVFAMVLAFVVALYVDMLARGPIPLFAGLDRIEYNSGLAGPLHAVAFDFGFLFAAALGTFFVFPRLRGRDFDFRFLTLYLSFLVYFALTGNRFSAFYAFSSFFVLPLASLPAMKAAGRLRAPPASRAAWKSLLCSRSALLFGIASGGLAILALLVNSVVNVRAYDDPAEQFTQRILIQPSQLWWTTWESLKDRSTDAFDSVWEGALINPIDPTRNTSIQVLMVKNLGDERATELIGQGTQYNGGYPEILFELTGPWVALPVALAFSCITAWLLRLCVVSICRGRFATAFMALYVFFGFSLLYMGGMLNFLFAWTFLVKVLALFLAWFLERNVGLPRRAARRRRISSPQVAA